jgi:5,10-methylenetetrahydrofolate reductase
MGAYGALPENKKFVLTIEIQGPKTAADAEKVSDIVAELKRQFGASVTAKQTGKSKPACRSSSKPKRKAKGKSKRK